MQAMRRWPVRWRLTATSAALTLIILVVFAVVIGRLATDRLKRDFNTETRSAASALAIESRVGYAPGQGVVVEHPVFSNLVLPNASVRIVTADGAVVAKTRNAPDVGPPHDGLVKVGTLAVATAEVPSNAPGPTAYVQYMRNRESLDETINRLWIFLGFGVLGGTGLAMLAGLTIAGRAMRPIASLTTTAREIAETGDPSQRMPEPETDDEIAELAKTLEAMLRSLDASRAETQRAMQKQREFVADASHELRTPLTSVLANLELLQASLNEPAQAEDGEIIDSALRSSRRMSRLVSDLLLLARADSGRASDHLRCDLDEVVAGAVAEIEPVADGHEIRVKRSGSIPLDGNPDELHRMVGNLLENAIRHTPAGTAVDVSVSRANGTARLDVDDSGPGIPAELREQVFGRFVRGEGPADTAGAGGAGLGLSIVRAVAESHGGKVWTSPSADGGAGFHVELPVA